MFDGSSSGRRFWIPDGKNWRRSLITLPRVRFTFSTPASWNQSVVAWSHVYSTSCPGPFPSTRKEGCAVFLWVYFELSTGGRFFRNRWRDSNSSSSRPCLVVRRVG